MDLQEECVWFRARPQAVFAGARKKPGCHARAGSGGKEIFKSLSGHEEDWDDGRRYKFHRRNESSKP